ncbi:pyridoxal phosphate-dependent aminotransferase [Sporosarcina limicola]|uniref:Histidinol-phosphate aminotransferase n=1 Tax=Sporosarcina limicola TaxID=34101 RepID=A0A927MSY6_9BACL|nr:histidinol-phosphate transaminase [Sporosarcina limicola]MBE1556839.1 histidinol-phosphate aminotransferase [Sporosarcina limicola]
MQQKVFLQSYNSGVFDASSFYRMHLSENPNAMSPKIKSAIENELRQVQFYPDPDCTLLKESIAKHFNVKPQMILVGNGTDEVLLFIALALLGVNKTGLTTESTFPGYKVATALSGANNRFIPMDNFRIPVSKLVEACKKDVDAVFVCNPHNPSGTTINYEELQQLLIDTSAMGVIPIIDEAYADFAGDSFASAIPFIREGGNAIVMRTFSKSHSIAGLRVGYAIGSEQLIAKIQQLRTVLPFSVNRIAQAAAIAAIDDTNSINTKWVNEVKEYFYLEMDRINIRYIRSKTNFVLIKVPGEDGLFSRRLIEEYKIITRDTTSFGYEGYIRVSMGSYEQMEYVCKAIEILVKELR